MRLLWLYYLSVHISDLAFPKTSRTLEQFGHLTTSPQRHETCTSWWMQVGRERRETQEAKQAQKHQQRAEKPLGWERNALGMFQSELAHRERCDTLSTRQKDFPRPEWTSPSLRKREPGWLLRVVWVWVLQNGPTGWCRSSALLPAQAAGQEIHVTRGEMQEQSRNESPSAAGHLIHSPSRRQVLLHTN